MGGAPGGRGAALRGMGGAPGGRDAALGGRGAASGDGGGIYAMPFGTATNAVLAAQQANDQYYEDAIYYSELYMAEQEAMGYTVSEPAQSQVDIETEEAEATDSALPVFAATVYPGLAAELGRNLLEAFDISGGSFWLDNEDLDLDDNSVDQEPMVFLEARVDAPPTICRH
eukprot:3422181-Rhodomonas_salina.1